MKWGRLPEWRAVADGYQSCVMSEDFQMLSPILRDATEVEEAVVASAWPRQDGPDLFGIEVEAFPLLVGPNGPAGRLSLEGAPPNVSSIMTEVAAAGDEILGRAADRLAFPTRTGGWITFEPGAQIEHSSAPGRTTAAERTEMAAVWNQLRAIFWEHRVCLLSLGVDPWNDAADIPQQLTIGRYVAMDSYLATRSGAGATMMRNTCSVQVNVDAGNGETRRERWLASQLLSPILTAMFATSPGPGACSRRAQAWQQLDPTRTGFPSWDTAEDADPVGDTVARALEADVMFISRNGATTPGKAGWSFADWLRDGHPTWGPPTLDDLESHLTTLFTEVRPRGGVLEMRGLDGLTEAWWHVPLVTVAALLYDPTSRGRAIELLEPLAPHLDAIWRRSAAAGLADPQIASLAAEIAQLATEAARRDPLSFDPADTAAVAEYFEEFTFQRRSPANLLATMLDDPAAALGWAAPQHATKGVA